jgi:uncharacterized protein
VSPTPLWDALLGGFALMLVAEGLLPLLSPARWRSVFERALKMNDGQIRFLGMLSLVSGVLLALLALT